MSAIAMTGPNSADAPAPNNAAEKKHSSIRNLCNTHTTDVPYIDIRPGAERFFLIRNAVDRVRDDGPKQGRRAGAECSGGDKCNSPKCQETVSGVLAWVNIEGA